MPLNGYQYGLACGTMYARIEINSNFDDANLSNDNGNSGGMRKFQHRKDIVYPSINLNFRGDIRQFLPQKSRCFDEIMRFIMNQWPQLTSFKLMYFYYKNSWTKLTTNDHIEAYIKYAIQHKQPYLNINIEQYHDEIKNTDIMQNPNKDDLFYQKNGGWYAVNQDGEDGWISSNYLEILSDEEYKNNDPSLKDYNKYQIGTQAKIGGGILGEIRTETHDQKPIIHRVYGFENEAPCMDMRAFVHEGAMQCIEYDIEMQQVL